MLSTEYYDDVIMTTIASQITSLTSVYSTVYSDAHQRKHQSSASLAFVWGIHRDRWIPRTKGQLRGKCFHLMTSSWYFPLRGWLNWFLLWHSTMLLWLYFFKRMHSCPGPWINIQMSLYQYRKFNCGDKTILRPSYVQNGISYTGKMISLYWIRVQFIIGRDALATIDWTTPGLILGLRLANERRCYFVTTSPTGWAQA